MWKYWPTLKLQEEIGNYELDFLEKAIPEIEGISADSFIAKKSKLATIVECLKDHNYFRNKINLEKCLWFVPRGDIDKLCEQINYKGKKDNYKKLSSKILDNEKNYELFISFFNLDKRFLSKDNTTQDTFFDNYPASPINPKIISSPFKNLKSFQYECYSNCQKLLDPPLSRTILQMPTGSGKTRTASEVISGHLNEAGIKQVIWLANTRELCEQAIQCMSEVWDHIGRKTCRFNRLWDGNINKIPSWIENECVFSVMSLQSGWSELRKNKDDFYKKFSNTTLIIVDEAHIAVAQTYKEVIENLVIASHPRVLGLTATPGRTIQEDTYNLSELFNYNITSLNDPDKKRDNTIAYLRSINVMSKAEHHEIIYENSFKISEKEKHNIADGKDYSDAILKKIGEDVYRTISIINELRKQLDQKRKIILFAPSVQNSFLTSSILTFLNYKSVHVSGKTPPKTRDLLIDKYLNDEYQIMCNYGVLATGFDAPKVDVVCIARPTMSPVLYSQMIGRGLRGKAVGGTDECMILEVKDNFIGLPNQDILYSMYSEYWSN